MDRSSPPWLQIGFRPFFLLALAAAVTFPTFWVSIYSGYLSFHGPIFTSRTWHAHEMIFAFPWALIAGFLLTASSNWTGKAPVAGKSLKFLLLTWIMARILLVLPLPSSLVISASMIFPVVFLFVMARYLKGHPRQFNIFVPFLGVFAFANLLYLIGGMQTNQDLILIGQELGLDLIRFLVLLISGRVLPFFTHKRMPDVDVRVPTVVNYAVLWSAVVLALPVLGMLGPFVEGAVLVFAIVANIVRLYLWKPFKVVSEPMLWVLHAAALWVVIGMALEFWQLFDRSLEFTKIPLHAFATGALGMFAIGITARVSLGHTGRPIKADGWIITAFLSVFLGAALRVFVPLFWPQHFIESLHHASGWWTFGFLIQFFRLFNILRQPRPDGKPG